jgi:NAD(P)-dependent dehydrogenase (short-subunit alcohol dehydrogenase family)
MSERQRVAIVTGAAGGIGRELVVGLLGNEIRVAAVDRTAPGSHRARTSGAAAPAGCQPDDDRGRSCPRRGD